MLRVLSCFFMLIQSKMTLVPIRAEKRLMILVKHILILKIRNMIRKSQTRIHSETVGPNIIGVSEIGCITPIEPSNSGIIQTPMR